MKRTKYAWLVVAAGLWAGCDGGEYHTIDASSGAPREVSPAVSLVARANPPIGDVPVPLGFDLDEDKSRSYSLPGARFVDHTYRGGAEKFAVKRFYERHMPVSRWTLATAMYAGGEIALDYEKQSERCRVVIGNGGLFDPTTITVRVWTSGRVQQPEQ